MNIYMPTKYVVYKHLVAILLMTQTLLRTGVPLNLPYLFVERVQPLLRDVPLTGELLQRGRQRVELRLQRVDLGHLHALVVLKVLQ